MLAQASLAVPCHCPGCPPCSPADATAPEVGKDLRVLLFSAPCDEARCRSPSAGDPWPTRSQLVALFRVPQALWDALSEAPTEHLPKIRLRVSWLGALIHHFHNLLFVLQFLNCITKNHSGSPEQRSFPLLFKGKR